MLGDISPLKPRSPPDEDMPEEEPDEVDEEGFIKPKVRRSTLWKQKCSERAQIFQNMTDFLDGFAPREKQSSSN